MWFPSHPSTPFPTGSYGTVGPMEELEHDLNGTGPGPSAGTTERSAGHEATQWEAWDDRPGSGQFN